MVESEKLKTRRPPTRLSAVLLKHTKPSRPSREDVRCPFKLYRKGFPKPIGFGRLSDIAKSG